MPTILIPLTCFVPESPMWFITRGKDNEARKILRKLRAYDDKLVDDEVRVMRVNYEKRWLSLAVPSTRRIFNGHWLLVPCSRSTRSLASFSPRRMRRPFSLNLASATHFN
ncbi:hypothetical protein V1522DRAFT_414534 [Lipomyces starkeyi]